MKYLFLSLFLIVSLSNFGQTNLSDSIAHLVAAATSVDEKIVALNKASSALKDADMKKSLDYALQARDLALQASHEDGLAQAYLNLGKNYTRLGRHDEAMENYLKALEIGQRRGDEKLIGQSYKIIGNGYYFRNDLAMALQYYRRALAVNTKIHDAENAADLQNNIALIFIGTNKLDSALIYLSQSVVAYEALKKEGKLANALLNIGELKNKAGEYGQAIEFYTRALVINRSLGLRLQEAYTLNNMSVSLIRLMKYKEAHVHCDQALAIAQAENFHPLLLAVYENMYTLSKAEKNWTLALDYHEKLMLMKDSVFSEQKDRQIEELRTKYESEQKEKENILLQRESDLKERQLLLTRSALVIILAFALVVTVLAISYYKSYIQNKQAKNDLLVLNRHIEEQKQEIASINENLEALVREKTSRILEQHNKLIEYAFTNSHRVRGPLARILGLVKLVLDGAIKEDEMRFILKEMDVASNELDTVVKEISNSLNGVINQVTSEESDTTVL